MYCIIEQMDFESIKRICDSTRDVDPGKNEYRVGRLTASSVGKFLNCYKKTCPIDPILYLTEMFQEKFTDKTSNEQPFIRDCLKYGTEMEDSAKSAFLTKLARTGVTNITLRKDGFNVDPYVGIFGCTPDGRLLFEDGTEALLETKCPYVVRDFPDIKQVCLHPIKKRTFELQYDKATRQFSMNMSSFKGRKYNDQMQLSMWVTGVESTYFCVFLKKDVKYIVIPKDDDWAQKNIPNLCRLYRDFYMDKLGRDICERNIANREAFNAYAEKGVPLDRWPEDVWHVKRVKPRGPPDPVKKLLAEERRADRKRDEMQRMARSRRDQYCNRLKIKPTGAIFLDD